ncbi:MAG: YqjF family protein [Leucobacter sp.]
MVAASPAVHVASIDPRPPAAARMPINAQTWESLSLLHWEVPVSAVQRRLPPGLIADELDGRTWLGVVPFVMSGVRVPPLPAIPRWSVFPELNARVYVHDLAGNRGVWFLNLWCSSGGFVASARALGLPYRRAHAHVGLARTTGGADAVAYRFLRSRRRAAISFEAAISAAEAADASSGLTAWLTARWNMFAVRGGRLWRYPVHHEPWTLCRAITDELRTDVPERLGFAISGVPPLAHVADAVHALVGVPRLAPRP